MKTRSIAPALLLMLAASANAQGQDALYVKSLAANCAGCHGTDGRTVGGAGIPGLAGMPGPYIAAQLRAFKAGTRPATVMTQLSKGFSDAQIDQLAGYFSAQKP